MINYSAIDKQEDSCNEGIVFFGIKLLDLFYCFMVQSEILITHIRISLAKKLTHHQMMLRVDCFNWIICHCNEYPKLLIVLEIIFEI
jgi:hypothetical protein